MSRSHVEDLMRRAMAGENVSDDPAFGPPLTVAPHVEISDEVMVGKSVRVPMPMVERIMAVAEDRGSDWSKTIRRWIEEGLARDEETAEADPVALVRRGLDTLLELEHRLGGQKAA